MKCPTWQPFDAALARERGFKIPKIEELNIHGSTR